MVDVNWMGKNGWREVSGDYYICVEVWCFVDGDIIDGFIWVIMYISSIIRELLFMYWFNCV